jgi:hypothetical protein
MRSGRENLLVAAWAFLSGMLVTLVTTELASEQLMPRARWLFLGVIGLVVVALHVFWWWFFRRVASGSGKTTTLEELEKKQPSESTGGAEPPARKGGAAVGAREPGGASPRSSTAVWSPPAPSPAPPPKGNPFPLPTSASPVASRPPADPVGSASWSDPVSRADSSRLIDVWETYLKSGAMFNETGLRRQLETSQIDADVIPGSQFGGGDSVHAVDLKDGSGILYLLPDFAKPPRALEEWFQSRDSGSRMARIKRLVRPATARRSGGRINLESKGEVE